MDNQAFKQQLIRRSYHFSLVIIKFLERTTKRELIGEIIARQLLRSATSIGANVVEAQAASSKRDFTNFLNHALKSANETAYWVGLLRDSGKVQREGANQILQEAVELAKLLGSSVSSLKKQKH